MLCGRQWKVCVSNRAFLRYEGFCSGVRVSPVSSTMIAGGHDQSRLCIEAVLSVGEPMPYVQGEVDSLVFALPNVLVC